MISLIKLFTVMFILTPVQPLQANEALKEKMKTMYHLVKDLSLNIGNPQQNPQCAQKAHELAQVAESCKQEVPDKVATLPEPEKTARLAEFKQSLEFLKAHYETIEYSLLKNKNDVAQPLMSSIKDIMAEGHDKFK